jgi:hypothetical protein
MFEILTIVPGKKKLTQSGWHGFNAVCCHHRGHKADKRGRAGLRIDGPNWSMHCFNCGFKCGFTLGKSITQNTRNFLQWCGIEETQIQRWSLESLQKKDILDFIKPKNNDIITFSYRALPDDCESLNISNPKHFKYIEYLEKRGIHYDSYPFKVTPIGTGRVGSRKEHRIIIPYFYKSKIVGNTSRFLDNKSPKYYNVQQPGYVFNIDKQSPSWSVCILTEGIFDALSIDGLALMHNDISSDQAKLISTLNRPVILVPDRDITGLKLCNRALELGYKVSIPNWDSDIKDVNDAVVRYGKLPTLLSILQYATSNRVKIEIQRRKLEQRI